ncbi:allantoate amidohydrolase [Catenuloplanes atrovinosus]|uniref:N-carbamoyl-L-amino-acid hydrolase n=1 Tax=Catenuloplanes atrovinosus TaxID=137266 RepID=A0AAE3YV48_9ACTN|nr:allantoate amidohydrolase [Catenuloplanes atrovinosus]MDR7278994.1 N-carbamoyl-L-amino-acid hydrolase [Catenuloplanes atrovinosus]
MSAFTDLWRELADVGGSPEQGYVRFAWTPAEWELRSWFRAQARYRDLAFEVDGNTTMWATWNPGGAAGPAVVTGSHLDSVPHGGGYDGPLGVVSAFLAVDLLRRRGVTPARPIRIAAFAEEEGSRFGVACLGSRLMTGAFDPGRARALTDRDGVTLAEALSRYDFDPARLGPVPLDGVHAFVELHVEQGRALTVPVGIGSSVWPHGRWRMDFTGEGNHAGTTLMGDRRDPMLTYAFSVLAANKEARVHGAHATVGRVAVHPNATNAIPSRVTGWLDARAASTETLDALLASLGSKIATRAARDGTGFTITAESTTGEIGFSDALIRRCVTVLGEDTPVLPTGAGHDAGVLSGSVPTVMLFVRNPTGVSHAPAERAEDEDCEAGVTALAAVLEELACR